MVRLRMRLLPEKYNYSRTFHVLFSTLCKEVKRTPGFYSDLAKIRAKIKFHGIDALLEVVAKESILSITAKEYFEKMKSELPKVGRELQAKTLAYLLSLKEETTEQVQPVVG